MAESLVSQYVRALREEPKLRAFAAASLVDDIGIAVAAWAMDLLKTNLFTDQRARATLMLPSLVCFLLGTIVSGPLADWAARYSLARLARWRWRLVMWARLAETLVLVSPIVALSSGPPTIGSILPFAMVTAFTKTAFRPTRIAFSVDLLRQESVQVDPNGAELTDERGKPLTYKTHFLTMNSLVGALSAASVLGGLLLGGRILAAAQGQYMPVLVVYGVMHVAFVAVVFFTCHPSRGPRDVRVSELWKDAGEDDPRELVLTPPRMSPLGAVREFGSSLAGGIKFLAQPQQRSLLILLMGAALVELVTEAYDGKMIVKHLLGGSNDSVRYAEVGWEVVAVIGVAVVPVLARAVGSIGRIFLVTMLVDGLVIMAAGQVAAAAAATAIVPFVVILGADHTLTLASNSLADLAQASASSAAMRGRIAGTYAFFVIIGDMIVEGLATSVSEAIGIPAMMVRIGLLQVVVVAVLAAWGGRKLWRFGLREEPASQGATAMAPAA